MYKDSGPNGPPDGMDGLFIHPSMRTFAQYCQGRGIDDTEQPLTPALSPSEGAREKPPQLWV